MEGWQVAGNRRHRPTIHEFEPAEKPPTEQAPGIAVVADSEIPGPVTRYLLIFDPAGRLSCATWGTAVGYASESYS